MTDSTPMAATWMGRDINTLSREELIEVVFKLAADLDEARRSIHSIIEINELARRHQRR